MKILLLCGSIAEKSHTLSLLDYIGNLFSQEKHKVTLWDLKKKPLPFALPECHKDPTKHPDEVVRNFVDEVEHSDIIILGSPLYHGSFSGVLKNALDNLRYDALRGKWVGLVGNSGSIRADHLELSPMRQVVNTLVGYSAQTQVGSNKSDYSETDKRYVLEDEDIKKRSQRLVDELLSVN